MSPLRQNRSERRIARRVKQLFGEDKEWDLPRRVKKAIDSAARRGGNIGKQLYLETEKRKGRGKKYLKRKAKRAIFGSREAARSLLKGDAKPRRRRKR